jgi:hypothetical protein
VRVKKNAPAALPQDEPWFICHTGIVADVYAPTIDPGLHSFYAKTGPGTRCRKLVTLIEMGFYVATLETSFSAMGFAGKAQA